MLQTQGGLTPPPTDTFAWVDLDDLHSEPLRAGVQWWRTQRGDRPYPARDELKPRHIAGLLACMSLLKVIDGGADFEHRIVGDVMVQAFNVRLQNRRFSEIAEDAPEFIARCIGLFRAVVETGAPLAWRAGVERDSTAFAFTHGEAVLLPLGHDKVDHILGFGYHGWDAHVPFTP